MKTNNDYLNFIAQLADEAAHISLKYFRQIQSHEKKEDYSPVTIVDREIENKLSSIIESNYPDHGIIREEFANKKGSSDYYWVIDPIDGTKNFISGLPLYGTLIALMKDDKAIASIIDCPAISERWLGNGVTSYHYRQGKQQSHSNRQTDSLKSAIVCSTDPVMFNELEMAKVSSLQKACSIYRYNGDCYLYGLLSSGYIDLVVESDLKPFDFLPLIPIIEGNNGIITDWQGRKLDKNSRGQVLASANKTLHNQAIEVLNQ